MAIKVLPVPALPMSVTSLMRSSNGFNYIISKFRPEPIAAHIELQKGERSELAELAANIL